jgi:hypothetical protein
LPCCLTALPGAAPGSARLPRWQVRQTRDRNNAIFPRLPYFLSFFLCRDRDDAIYTGGLCRKQGRYRCADSPPEGGKGALTRLDLSAEFKAAFGKAPPPVTGFAIEIDTRGLPDGRSSAWIKSIRFASQA